jgi:glutamine amidotransferase
MKQLQERGLSEVLTRRVIGDEVPVLGICLGMQMFMQSSEEGILKGLSWLEGKVVRFSSGKIGELKIPHMGWAGIQVQKTSRLFAGMYDDPRFYFVHSYHVVSDDPGHVICTATHGYEFVAGVEKGNIVGIQFHPEKSHKYGMKILRNFVDNY